MLDFSDRTRTGISKLISRCAPKEVPLRANQFEGVKGLSTENQLFQMWQEMLDNAEDYRAATVVTSVDYSKAFNRMSFQHWLSPLVKNGASSKVLRIVSPYGTHNGCQGRRHTLLCHVTGGCPQGSILVFLLNLTIDNLKEGCEDLNEARHVQETAEPERNLQSTPIRRGDPGRTQPEESPVVLKRGVDPS